MILMSCSVRAETYGYIVKIMWHRRETRRKGILTNSLLLKTVRKSDGNHIWREVRKKYTIDVFKYPDRAMVLDARYPLKQSVPLRLICYFMGG